TLALLANPEDIPAFRFWLGYGSPSWNAGQYLKLRKYCEEHGEAPREVLRKVQSGEINFRGINALISRFQELNSQLAELNNKEIEDIIDALFPADTEWSKILRESSLLKLQEFEGDDDEDENSFGAPQ